MASSQQKRWYAVSYTPQQGEKARVFALSEREAAIAYYLTNPQRNDLFCSGVGTNEGRTITYNEICELSPTAFDIFNCSTAERKKIRSATKKKYSIEIDTEKEDMGFFGRCFVRFYIKGVIFFILFVAACIYLGLTGSL